MAVREPQPVPVPDTNTVVPVSAVDRAPDPVPSPPPPPPIPVSAVDRAPNPVDVPVTSTAPPVSAIDLAPDPVTNDPTVNQGRVTAPAISVTPAAEVVPVPAPAPSGGGGTRPVPVYISVDRNGNVVVPSALTLNFIGAGVSVVANGSQADITIPGGGGGNLGNWAFLANTMYNFNGGDINNGDLSHGATASITMPANGDANSLSLLNYYGEVALTSGTNPGSTKTWVFGTDGRLVLPNNGVINTTGATVDIGSNDAISLEAAGVVNVYTDTEGTTYQWQFGDDGNLTLPTNSASINYANGAPYGGATTGQWAFNGDTAYNSTNNGLYIQANEGIDDGGAYFPYANEASTTRFYNNSGAGIEFSAGANAWIFNTDASVQFPQINVARGDNPSGNINGYTLVMGDGSNEAIITTPNGDPIGGQNSQRLVINPGKGADGTSGEGGDIYLWAGRGGSGDIANAVSGGSGGDIKIRGGQGGGGVSATGDGGYIRMEGGDSSALGGSAGFIEISGGVSQDLTGGYVNIDAGQGVTGGDANLTGGVGTAGSGGAVRLTGGTSANGLAEYGNIYVQSGVNTWVFDNTGNLVTPANLVIGTAPGGSGSSILQYDAPLQIVGESPNATIVMGWAANTNVPDSIAVIGFNTPYPNGASNVIIAVGNNATTVNYWNFDNTGALTLPQGGTISEQTNPDGFPGHAIVLTPTTVIDPTQQLLVYPTGGADYNHLHLTSGNLYNTELFLGNDNLYVKLANTGNVVINSNDDFGNTAQWTFGANGVVNLPGEGVLQSIDDTVTLRSFNTTTGNANIVYLGTSGGLGFFDQSIGANWLEIFRSGTDPQMATTGNLLIRTDSTNTAPTWTFDNTGNLNAPGNVTASAAVVGQTLVSTYSAVNEGGEITLALPSSGTTLTGDIRIDSYQDWVRIFEGGGNSRGMYVDIPNVSTSGQYAIGYRDVPQIVLSGNITANSITAGKHFYSTTAGNLQITIPDNANVAFPTGATLTVVVNAAGNVIVAQGTGVSLYMAGSSTTGNRTVGAYGLASVMKVATDTWVISGTGVY